MDAARYPTTPLGEPRYPAPATIDVENTATGRPSSSVPVMLVVLPAVRYRAKLTAPPAPPMRRNRPVIDPLPRVIPTSVGVYAVHTPSLVRPVKTRRSSIFAVGSSSPTPHDATAPGRTPC